MEGADPLCQLFHLANQRESKTNTQIATSTAEVARQTQRDSASMITIAAVTMLFLPGTFISAILSTTFFDYGDDGYDGTSYNRCVWDMAGVAVREVAETAG
jgi:hypothetical protein